MQKLIAASDDLSPINAAMSHDGEALLVVMSDGELRMYDAHDHDLDLDLLASASGFLATPVETGFWGRPNVVTAPGAVFITDSVGGEVMQLDDHDLEVVNSWGIAGNPAQIAFVGILGETTDLEEHGHEEEAEDDGHGHGHGALDPHFWFDPLRVQQAVNSISAGFRRSTRQDRPTIGTTPPHTTGSLTVCTPGSRDRSRCCRRTAGCWSPYTTASSILPSGMGSR